jgi:CRISPR-associated endoribonuclease Cas6
MLCLNGCRPIFLCGFPLPVEFAPQIVAEKEVLLPTFTGHMVRGILLNMLHQVDPSLAAMLHEPDVPKPYSVTGLYFRSKGRAADGYVLDPAYPCTFKIRFLNDQYAQEALKYFREKATIMVADTTFHLATVSVKSETYQDLAEKAFDVEAFRLVFKSPTYLASKGAKFHHLFPEPRRLFLNLAKLWNQNAKGNEIKDVESYARWLKLNLGVSGYALETRLVRAGKREGIGFTGWTNYRSKEAGEWNRFTSALARFAEYSNVGANRTGGFGVTRYFAKPLQAPNHQEHSVEQI